MSEGEKKKLKHTTNYKQQHRTEPISSLAQIHNTGTLFWASKDTNISARCTLISAPKLRELITWAMSGLSGCKRIKINLIHQKDRKEIKII